MVIGVRSETPSALHDRDIAARIGADDGELGGAAVGEGDRGVRPPLAASTTWLLVRIRPSEDRMIPEPSSDARPMSVSSFTTLGTTLAATCSTDPAGRLAAGTLGAAVIDVPPRSGCRAWPSVRRHRRCPPKPRRSSSAPAVKAPARERFGAGRPGGSGVVRLLGRAAVRVIGLPIGLLLLLCRVSPVVGLLRGSRCARADRDIPPCGHRRADGPGAAAG